MTKCEHGRYFFDYKDEVHRCSLCDEVQADIEICDEEDCQHCCDHEHDPSEGMMCINCGKEYNY